MQAAAVWVGGLAFVVLALVYAREQRWPLAASAVPRFSTMAVLSVAVLLAAGALNGYLQVRAWRGLWETEYGVLLLIKVGLVLPLLALGAYNNRYAVPRLRAQIASVLERRRFLRFASAELGIMVAIVGVTAVLVNAPPARTEVEMDEMVEIELELGPFMAHMEVMPAMAGRTRCTWSSPGTARRDQRVGLAALEATSARCATRPAAGWSRARTWSGRRTCRPPATGRSASMSAAVSSSRSATPPMYRSTRGCDRLKSILRGVCCP